MAISRLGTITQCNRVWPNRDPIRESGFKKLSKRSNRQTPVQWAGDTHAYSFFDNDPIMGLDAYGLEADKRCLKDAEDNFKRCASTVKCIYSDALKQLLDLYSDCKDVCGGAPRWWAKLACNSACTAAFTAAWSGLTAAASGAMAGCALNFATDSASCDPDIVNRGIN